MLYVVIVLWDSFVVSMTTNFVFDLNPISLLWVMRVLVLQKPHLTSLSALPAKWTTEQNSESVVTRQNWFMSQSQSCQCVMRGPAWWLTPLLITRWWWSSLLVVPCPPSPQARPGVGWCVAPVPQCQCGRQSQVCCGVTAAHNCAHHHPHWPASPLAQH